MRAKIVSTGYYAPPRVETAEDLAPRIGVGADWIIRHTGVLRRHISDEPMEVMAARAARDALGAGGPPDLILNASTTPRQLIPDSAVFIQRELGLEGIPGHTVHATCLSFMVALHSAAAYLACGAYKRILVVSSEVSSPSRNFTEPESASLFGDGAAAAVVEPTPAGESSAVLGYAYTTFPSGAELTELRGAGIRCHPNSPDTRPEDNLFHMDGPRVYKMARRRSVAVVANVMRQAGLGIDDVDLVVPHQASGPALEAYEKYGFPKEKVVQVLEEYGNCIAASIPMALAIAHQQGRMQRGDILFLGGTGAGLSIGAMVIRW